METEALEFSVTDTDGNGGLQIRIDGDGRRRIENRGWRIWLDGDGRKRRFADFA